MCQLIIKLEWKLSIFNISYPYIDISLFKAEIQLFDPNDPKVRDLEEWNCSINEKSLYEEVIKHQTQFMNA